jgi:twitching motility two-component system response regulator PilH
MSMPVRKVLCVDDSAADLLNIEKIVANFGVFVSTARNGKEAVAKVLSEKPDLVFLDVNMPEMDGFAALREIRKVAEFKTLPVVLVTSKNQKADKMWAQVQGASGYVTKPYTDQEIVAQLRAF